MIFEYGAGHLRGLLRVGALAAFGQIHCFCIVMQSNIRILAFSRRVVPPPSLHRNFAPTITKVTASTISAHASPFKTPLQID
jgi:hypothetical protein